MTANRFPTACVEFNPNLTLESMRNLPSFYWAHMLLHTLGGIPELKLPPIRGVILSGAPGNGRHTIAMGLCGTLKERGWPFFARITGIALDAEDVADACAVIDIAMSKLPQQGRICLLLDCPEDSRHNLAVQEYLRQQMEAHPGMVFPVLITKDTANITPVLQTLLTPCQFQCPDLDTRRTWLKTYLEGKPAITIDGGMNYITLAKETNGFTWRQLTDLRALLRRTIALKYFENPRIYESAGPRETLLTNGTIHLTRNEVNTALACIRTQAVTTTAAPVQYAAAMPTSVSAAGTAPAAPPPPAARESAPSGELMTGEEKDAALKAIEFHGNPDKMSFADLTDIDSL